MALLARYPYSLYQKIYEVKCKHKYSWGDILMFHQINEERAMWEDSECSISETSFVKFFEKLLGLNVRFGALPEIFNSSKREECHDIYVTFDDAYAEVFTIAMPLLVKHNIPFTVFMATDWIGKKNYLSLEMLRELAKCPLCTIGSHTMSHKMLRWENGDMVRKEVVDSREELGKMLGEEIKIFAYPYGSIYACSRNNIKQVSKVGYEMAVSTINSGLTFDYEKSRFFLPRRNINENNYESFLGGIEREQV